MKRVILKLSGEAFGSKDASIDTLKINEYVRQIKLASSIASIGIVIGGGNFFRGRDAKEFGIDSERVDYMGMLGTVMNSIYLESTLNNANVKAKALSLLPCPTAVESYSKEKANEYLENGYVVIYAGGTGNPNCSTDTASVLRAIDTNASLILMAKSGVDGVYSADPKTCKNAIRYDIISHRDILDKNLNVMDLNAALIASDNDISFFVFDMNDTDAIIKAVKGEQKGTIIKKEI